MSAEEFLSFLNKRKGLLDGVCITGGEPLLHRDLKALLKEIKAAGFAVKLDTNGMFPDRLKEYAAEGLIDYVAMDIKNAPARYGETVRCKGMDFAPLSESIAFLLEGSVDYEFRTTVAKGLHTEEEIRAIAKWIKGAKRYFLQQYKESEQVPDRSLQSPSNQEMRDFLKIARELLPVAELRGVD